LRLRIRIAWGGIELLRKKTKPEEILCPRGRGGEKAAAIFEQRKGAC